MKRSAIVGIVLLGLVTASGALWATMDPVDGSPIPVAAVQRGTVAVTVRTMGDIRAARAVQVFAPPAGGTLTIVALAQTGAALKAGDTVVEFDSADQLFALEQARSDLALAQQEIVKAEAQAAVQAAEDEVALLKAKYEVRRAELDASGNELVGAIVARQNLLLLEEARQKLAQLDREIASRRETSRTSAQVLREKANKARVAVAVAERNIQNLKVVAPFDGHVTVRQNMMAMGGVMFAGAVMPDFRVGDSAFPGTAIADLVDTSRVEVTAKLSERDRANVETGQSAAVIVDGLPDASLAGKVRAVSSVASRRVFEAGGTRQFDLALDILNAPDRIWPGTSAAITISGATFEDALSVPRAAVFDVGGTPTLYVRSADGFEPQPVKVRAWTDTLAVVEDIAESTLVALIDPTEGERAGAAASAPSLPRAAAAP